MIVIAEVDFLKAAIKTVLFFSMAILAACAGHGSLSTGDAEKTGDSSFPGAPSGGAIPPVVTQPLSQWQPSTYAGNSTGFANGIGLAARFTGPYGIVSDLQGNLYVTDTGNSIIRKITVATNEVTTFAGTYRAFGFVNGVGAAARFNGPQGISYDGQGNLYVADTGNAAIRKIVIATGAVTTVVGIPMVSGGETYGTTGYTDGPISTARFTRPTAAVFTGSGALYVLEAEYGVVRKIDLNAQIVSTVAGSYRAPQQDGVGSAARFSDPMGAVYDGQNALYITDFAGIRKLELSTNTVTTLAGGRSGFGSGFNDGIGEVAGFNGPQGIAYDGVDSLYVADMGGDTIRKISISTRAVTTFAGTALMIGPWDGVGNDAAFYWPRGITLDGNGSLFVADTQNDVVRKIDIASRQVTTIAGASTAVDGIGQAARLYQPVSMTSDGNGHIFLVDAGANNIRKIIINSAEVSTIAGNAMASGDYYDGVGTNARFNFPHGIASDGNDLLFIADTDNNRIRKINIATRTVTTLAGASQGSANGIGTSARFFAPWGVAYDSTGFLYVSDTWNSTIRKINLTSRDVTTIAGTPNQSCQYADAVSANAKFCRPAGLAYDGAGTLYIADRDGGYIRKLNVTTGAVTTLAGNNAYGPEVDAIGLAAKFNVPVGIYFDAKDSLFVSDWGGRTVRRVSVTTGQVTTIGGSDPACYYPNICPQTSSRFGLPMGVTVDASGAVYVGDTLGGVITKLTLK